MKNKIYTLTLAMIFFVAGKSFGQCSTTPGGTICDSTKSFTNRGQLYAHYDWQSKVIPQTGRNLVSILDSVPNSNSMDVLVVEIYTCGTNDLQLNIGPGYAMNEVKYNLNNQDCGGSANNEHVYIYGKASGITVKIMKNDCGGATDTVTLWYRKLAAYPSNTDNFGNPDAGVGEWIGTVYKWNNGSNYYYNNLGTTGHRPYNFTLDTGTVVPVTNGCSVCPSATTTDSFSVRFRMDTLQPRGFYKVTCNTSNDLQITTHGNLNTEVMDYWSNGSSSSTKTMTSLFVPIGTTNYNPYTNAIINYGEWQYRLKKTTGNFKADITICQMDGDYTWGNNVWNAYVFDGNGTLFNNYIGQFGTSTPFIGYNWTTGQPSVNNTSCSQSMDDSLFKVNFLMKYNFTAGNYKFRIRSYNGGQTMLTDRKGVNMAYLANYTVNNHYDVTSAYNYLSGDTFLMIKVYTQGGTKSISYNHCRQPKDVGHITVSGGGSNSGDTACNGNTITLTADTTDGTETQWWKGATCGTGTLIGTGASINVALDSSTTFYVRNRNYCVNSGDTLNKIDLFSNSCTSRRITLVSKPSAPSGVTPSSATAICSGASLNLNGTSSGNTIYWFTHSSGGSAIGNSASGANYSVSPSSSTTYYAESKAGTGCVSSTRTATGAITVNTTPSAPSSVTPSSATAICSGASLNLNGTSSGNTIYWFTQSSGGSAIGNSSSGANYSVSPGSSTTYYAEAQTSAGCVSASRSATGAVTVNANPSAPSAPAAQSACSDTAYTFTFDSVLAGSGGNQVEWAENSAFSGSSVISSGGSFNVSVAVGSVDTIWLRSRVSGTGCVSTTSVYTTAKVIPKPTAEELWETMMSSDNRNYYEIVNTLDPMMQADTADEEEDGLRARYERWKKTWASRIGASGDMNQSYWWWGEYESAPFVCENDYGANWKCIGPFNSEFDYCNANCCGNASLQKQNQGRIVSVAADLSDSSFQTFFAGGARGGIFKTTDKGEHWVNITDNSPLAGVGVSSIQLHPLNADIIFAATNGSGNHDTWDTPDPYGTGIWFTINGGITWKQTALRFPLTDDSTSWWTRLALMKVKVSTKSTLQHTTIYAMGTNIFWKLEMDLTDTASSGTSTELLHAWDTLIHGHADKFKDFEINPKHPDTIMVCSTPFILFSKDGGNNFYQANNPIVSSGSFLDTSIGGAYNSFDVFGTADAFNRFYIVFRKDSPSVGYIEFTEDCGLNWHTVTTTPFITRNDYFVINPSNDSIIYAETDGRCLSNSMDTGKSYHTVHTDGNHVDVRAVEIFPTDPNGGYFLLSGNDGGVSLCEDGQNLVPINGEGMNVGLYYGVATSENDYRFLLAGAQDGSLGTYNGKDWRQIGLGGDRGEPAISTIDDSLQFITINCNIYRSTNRGNTWTNGTDILPNEDFRVGEIAIDEVNDSIVYTGIKNVYRSRNAGVSWTQIDGGVYDTIDAQYPLSEIQIAPTNHHIVYTAKMAGSWNGVEQGGIWKATCNDTSNNCTWANISGDLQTDTSQSDPLDSAMITGLCIDDKDENRVFVSLGGFWGNSDSVHKVYVREFDSSSGYHWINMSTGLPNMPSNCIVYQKGTDDVLYLGTDVGVYWWDKPNQRWNKYCNGLGDIIVNKLTINYCSRKLYASTWGRGIWEADLIPSTMPEAEHIDTSKSISSARIDHRIIIDSGAVVTIHKSTIKFTKDMGITIMPGGKLIIDSSLITDACNCMWDGITLRGKPNEPQNIDSNGRSNQGYLVITASTIQNAYEAVRVHDNDGSNSDLGTGGIVQATGSSFINNRRSAEFLQYHAWVSYSNSEKNNKSFFANCTFVTDSNHRSEHAFSVDASLWDVRGVEFTGCTFENKNIRDNPSQLGHGIYSIDASYNVKNSLFKGFWHGVWANGAWNLPTVNITNSIFEENFRGASLYNTVMSTVAGNTFTCGAVHVPASGISYYDPQDVITGAELNGSTSFTFEQNHFAASDDMDNLYTIWTLGTWANNTGEENNIINDNDFTDMPFGAGVNGENRNFDGKFGLTLGCNDNIGISAFDFFVQGDNDTATLDGIKAMQGFQAQSVGNIFNTPLVNGDTVGEGHYYNHASQNISYRWKNLNELPIYCTHSYNGQSGKVNPVVVNTSANCISDSTGYCYWCMFDGTTINQMEIGLDSNHSTLSAKRDTLNTLMDEGDSEGLLSDIQSTEDAPAMKNRLVSEAPYISVKAVIQVGRMPNVFNDTMFLEVVSANPDVTNEARFNDYMNYKSRYLPEWINDSIEKIQPNTERTAREQEISAIGDTVGKLVRLLARDAVNDTNGIRHQDLRNYLGKLETTESAMLIAMDLMSTSELDEADSLISVIANAADDEKEKIQQQVTMARIQLRNMQDGKTLFELNETDRDSLILINGMILQEDNTYTPRRAKYAAGTTSGNILRSFYQSDSNKVYCEYQEEPQFPSVSGHTRIAKKEDEVVQKPKTVKDGVKVFPNPAKNLLYVQYETTEGEVYIFLFFFFVR